MIQRQDKAARKVLAHMARDNKRPQVRVQAWCALAGLEGVSPALLLHGLQDSFPLVRQQTLRRQQSILQLKGDWSRGATRFAERCAACHAFRGQGRPVGPDLASLADRSPAVLLQAILEPNAAVEDKYLSYAIEMTDGRSISGMISASKKTEMHRNAWNDAE